MYLGCSSESDSGALGAGRLTLGDFIRICGEELGLRAVELGGQPHRRPEAGPSCRAPSAAARNRLEIVDIALMNNCGVADDAKRRAEEARTERRMTASREEPSERGPVRGRLRAAAPRRLTQ